jgi:ribonuclease P/MRP protein subunit POP3
MALLDNVPTLTATWLASIPRHQLVPTHIKQVHTSAPKDMKAAKQGRLEGKALAKQRRKATEQSARDKSKSKQP